MPRFDIDASNVEAVQQMNSSEEDYDQNPLSQDEESLDGENMMEYSRPIEPSLQNPVIDSRTTSVDHLNFQQQAKVNYESDSNKLHRNHRDKGQLFNYTPKKQMQIINRFIQEDDKQQFYQEE